MESTIVGSDTADGLIAASTDNLAFKYNLTMYAANITISNFYSNTLSKNAKSEFSFQFSI